MKSGDKAKIKKRIKVSVPKNMPDYNGPVNPILEIGDALSYIGGGTKRASYLFSVLKLQGTGANCVALNEDEFEFIGGNWADE